MDHFNVFPDNIITGEGVFASQFLKSGITTFHEACRYVYELTYGYNSNRDDSLILFSEKKGSCTTKHAVIASLAEELGMPVHKYIGIYAMTEDIVTGTDEILTKYGLSYLPMIHCFLVYENRRVDLTEGNKNGKNKPLDDFLFIEKVIPDISAKDEYLLYRKAVQNIILSREDMKGADMKTILHAREEGIKLLRSKIL